MFVVFIKNKYYKWYLSIIKKSKKRNKQDGVYYEKHHVLPISLFPKYKSFKKYPWNCVYLTAKEHFIVHCLLPKFTSGMNRRKMIFGLKSMKMKNNSQIRYTSRLFEYYRNEIAIAISEQNKNKPSKNRGRKKTQQEIDAWRISITNNDKFITAAKENLKKACEANIGRKKSKEEIEKQVATTRERDNYGNNKGVKKPELSKKMTGVKKPEHSIKMLGSNNPKARKVTIDGITYNTLKQASETLKIPISRVRKYIS